MGSLFHLRCRRVSLGCRSSVHEDVRALRANLMPLTNKVARDGAWVDMEQHLRIDDWFSVGLAAQCATIFTSQTTPPTPTRASDFKR
jgi:hypothetical protein